MLTLAKTKDEEMRVLLKNVRILPSPAPREEG